MNVGMRPGTRSFVLLLLLAVFASASHAQTASDYVGKWGAKVDQLGAIVIELQHDGSGSWSGSARAKVDPDRVIQLREIVYSQLENVLTFTTVTSIPDAGELRSDFTLKYLEGQDMLKGRILINVAAAGIQREQRVDFRRIVEKAGASALSFQAARPFIGAWSARPDKKDKVREIQLEIVPSAELYEGTLTDTGIDETVGLRDLAIKDSSVSFNFRFDGAPFMSSFWGRYDPDRDEVRGSMSIGGRSQPLSFKRTSPGPDDVVDEFNVDKKPLVKKHDHRFAAMAHLAYWVPLHILKDNERNINDITTPSWGWDAGVRWYIVDYLALQLKYVYGGLSFDTNETNLALFDPIDGPQGEGLSRPLTTDSYLAMDGLEFSIVGYLGQSLFPTSRFNPYIIGVIGRTDWELTSAGRGTEPIAIFEQPVTGTDWTFGGGLGTEYKISHRFGLEFDWVWAYTMTEDETVWSDVTYQWTNQHVFRFSLGLVVWF